MPRKKNYLDVDVVNKKTGKVDYKETGRVRTGNMMNDVNTRSLRRTGVSLNFPEAKMPEMARHERTAKKTIKAQNAKKGKK